MDFQLCTDFVPLSLFLLPFFDLSRASVSAFTEDAGVGSVMKKEKEE